MRRYYSHAKLNRALLSGISQRLIGQRLPEKKKLKVYQKQLMLTSGERLKNGVDAKMKKQAPRGTNAGLCRPLLLFSSTTSSLRDGKARSSEIARIKARTLDKSLLQQESGDFDVKPRPLSLPELEHLQGWARSPPKRKELYDRPDQQFGQMQPTVKQGTVGWTAFSEKKGTATTYGSTPAPVVWDRNGESVSIGRI
jgi:hypothetical protein